MRENKKLYAFRFKPTDIEKWKAQAKKKSKNLTKFIEDKINGSNH